ncbi:ATP-grasp domain-containing protein [Metabacillus bambusae]|uniref:ATP-grasp domain-containing protein n=1 Tax=Metabacillus bambusae TaxID=2795218 RepID=A0ABS3N7V6_9BACI|nr:ATP-grasp domain-containing protein [Metabacillus bambusae]MBO1514121.1 ATP-grasp domain-containing protein [Metabacillus bambusae]
MEETISLINHKKEQIIEPIRPSATFQDIYGKGYVYNPKLYAHDYQHFAGDLLSLESLTARELSIVGDFPVVCHAATVTDPALSLLRKAGLKIPSILYTYHTEDEYIQLLNKLDKQNQRLIFQYPHPSDVFSSNLSWIDPEIQVYLCDKRNIPEFVPPKNVPKRSIMSIEQIIKEKTALPIILKTGDGRATSGGYGVLIIEEEKQLYEIDETFGDLSEIIVEEAIQYDENISLHYVVNKQGEINFLGKSAQIVNKDGCFRGSWITVDVDDKIAEIVETGYEVMKKVTEKGYVGVAGFDVLIRGENYYFIDLNIRLNASTCGLFLYDDIQKKYRKETVRLCNLEWMNDFDQLIPVVEKYMSKDQFVPLSFLDANYLPGENRVSKVIGLVIGHSTQEVEGVLDTMASDGLYTME